MFKKLIEGKFSLGETFWKFGVLGLIIVNIVSVISSRMLSNKLGRISISDYYLKYFHPLKIDNGVVVLTIFNIASLFVLVFYSFTILLATWRSSREYDKSAWLRHVSRLLMFLMVFVCLYTNL
ncbi:MAG: hypothetical protein ACK5N8_05700 [Alphaproteobacteria bacterium]